VNILNEAAPVLGRRRFLAGLAATGLTACAGTNGPTVSTQSIDVPDPLAAFRLLASAGPDIWAQHLPTATVADAPCTLAVSGGGEDGAFGAGALVGWSQTGTRPKFDIVTGVSTGALIAPFAFLGPEQDDMLRRIFTEYGANDIMKMRPLNAVFSDALYDTAPLADLIAHFTPPEVIDAVAVRHAAGARMFVVTSELDSARAHIWNMGAIAQAGRYDLFRGVMRASSALPGLFSPVDLQFEVGGARYAESHMDGGIHMQFLAIPEFALTQVHSKLGKGSVYVLINNTLDPAPNIVSRSALAISQAALTTNTRAIADAAVDATTLFAHANGLSLSVAAVSPDSGIVFDPSDRFSTAYMNAMYRHGYDRAIDGALWHVM
jgi:predicted acylesterase/phospholipase RssA